VAARDASKLARVMAEVQINVPAAERATEIVCDTCDAEAVDALVRRTRVVINYAGSPFIDKALPVVEACAKLGTSYVDITAELPLQRTTYDRFHAQCVESGALVIHSCGFDSVPADLSAFLAARQLRAAFDVDCDRLQVVLAGGLGGFSGGTIATGAALMGGEMDDAPGAADAARRGSYPLDPDGATGGPDTSDFGPTGLAGYDPDLKTWTTFSVMAPVNMPVVRKTNALLNYAYGREVRVGEAMETGSAVATALAFPLMAAGVAAVANPQVFRTLTAAGVLPSPGQGPPDWLSENGFFQVYALAVAKGDKTPKRTARADIRSAASWGDPGYRGTALMSVESALTLALDRAACPAATAGGVLTPASAMGDALVARLRKAGMSIEVSDSGPGGSGTF